MALVLPRGGRGQALALGVAVLGAAFVWAAAIDPALRWYHIRAEQLDRRNAVARRMAVLVESLPALRKEAEDAARGGAEARGADGNGPEGAGPAPAALLPGTSDALAAASLQQRIDEIAEQAGVRVTSQEILPPQPAGDLRAIPVRLTISAPYAPLAGLLLGFARSDTPMIASDIALRAQGARNRDGDPAVDVTLTVTAYRPAKAAGP